MTRTPLPPRRHSVSFDFRWGAVAFVGSVGFDRVQRPQEVFLHCSKTTSEIEAVGRDATILMSIALQRGASFEEMRHSITRDETGRPTSVIGAFLDAVEHVTADEVAGLLR